MNSLRLLVTSALLCSLVACRNDTPVSPRGAMSITRPLASLNATSARLRANVNTSALELMLGKLPPGSHGAVRHFFEESGGARSLQAGGDAVLVHAFSEVEGRPSEKSSPNSRVLTGWQKPVSLIAGAAGLAASTVRVNMEPAKPDVIVLASAQLTPEYLATALRAVATMRHRIQQSGKMSVTATIISGTKEIPESFRAYLNNKLALLAESRASGDVMPVLIDPLNDQ